MTDLRSRVEKGAELLDQKSFYGWRGKIDTFALDLTNGQRCILGQLYGDFFTGLNRLGLPLGDASSCGFDSEDAGWPQLTEEWRSYLLLQG